MPAYNNIDTTMVGMLDGLDNQIEGGWVARGAVAIEFGRPVFGYQGDKIGAYAFFKDTAVLTFDGDFVTGNIITITVNGVAADPVTFLTSQAVTSGLVVAAVEALTGVQCVADASDDKIFNIQVKGATAVVSETVTGGAGQVTGTPAYTTSQVFVGIAVKTQNVTGNYAQYDAVNVLVRGYVQGDSGTAANANEKAYVADTGLFANAGVEIGARFRGNLSAAGIVVTQMEGQKELGVAALFE